MSTERREGRSALQVAVIGASGCEPGTESWQLAEEIGRRLAEAGAAVVCGGMTGVMEAVSRGAAEAGGIAIGIVPSESLEQANGYCTHVVAAGTGHARNLAVVSSGQAVIAVGGEWGTLSEIGLARSIDRPVVLARSWGLVGRGHMEELPGVILADSAADAVAAALAAI